MGKGDGEREVGLRSCRVPRYRISLVREAGHPTSTVEDRVLTTRLHGAGEQLGIKLLDHVILGDERIYSFADHGLLGAP